MKVSLAVGCLLVLLFTTHVSCDLPIFPSICPFLLKSFLHLYSIYCPITNLDHSDGAVCDRVRAAYPGTGTKGYFDMSFAERSTPSSSMQFGSPKFFFNVTCAPRGPFRIPAVTEIVIYGPHLAFDDLPILNLFPYLLGPIALGELPDNLYRFEMGDIQSPFLFPFFAAQPQIKVRS